MPKFLDKLADALVPKEIAPYLGTIGTLIAPVAPGLGLTLGQLGSAKMYSGKLDPAQALAVGLGYYAGGGPQRRAEGKLFGQRLRSGIGSFMNPGVGVGTTYRGTDPRLADRFRSFGAGFREGSGPVTGEGLFDRMLGTTARTPEGQAYQDRLDTYNQEKANFDQQFANKEITKNQYNEQLKAAANEIVDE